jgi:hexosaminidase
MIRQNLPLVSAVALLACGNPAVARVPVTVALTSETYRLIPAPVSARFSEVDSFHVTSATVVHTSGGDGAAHVAAYLAQLIGSAVSDEPLRVERAGPRASSGGITLALGEVPDAGTEGYELTVMPDGVSLVANHAAGLFHGVQTLRQLFPAAIETSGGRGQTLSLPAALIVDYPRFEWRGAMLDVARNFLRPHEVKRYIDLMALHKLNRLHLHLSDDQGWRIEIKSWPNLALRGGSTRVGGGTGGFYTQEEYADIVRYAQQRFIIVVPEVDVPGHTNAALASYAALNCDNRARPLYTGIDVGFSALCVGREITYRFLDDVVREIAALTPGPYFHIGGDEVERLSDEQYQRFIERAQDIVTAHGKIMIGWGEIAAANLNPGSIVQHWSPNGSPLAAVQRGTRIILSPADRVYLDMKYDPSTTVGHRWAGYIEVRDSYDWDPATLLAGVQERSILGVEAPLWSETLPTLRDFEHMAFPRLAAVAEIAWSPAARRDWDGFRTRLGAQAPRWAALGINFYRSPQIGWAD